MVALQPFAICTLFQLHGPSANLFVPPVALNHPIGHPPGTCQDIPRTVQRLQRLQPLAQGLLPSITPGAASFAQRFARQLARRILLRLADDVERRASSALMMN